MSDGGTPSDPAARKETYLLDELQKMEGDQSPKGAARKIALAIELQKSTESGPVGTSPTSAVVQGLQDADGKEITAAMVLKAEPSQLEAWAKLDAEWDNDVMVLVQERLKSLREGSLLPSRPTPVSGSGGIGASQQPQPVAKLPSPEKVFDASVNGHQLKKPLIAMYRVNPGLAEQVRDDYRSGGNPCLSEGLLVRLAEAKLLWRDRNMYRGGKRSKSAGGQNGMIYKFYLTSEAGPSVGEWHVHWESGGRPGSPGWKTSREGEKSGGDDVSVMKKLLGTDWGKVAGSPGYRIPASE
jgi:hypothetical protein